MKKIKIDSSISSPLFELIKLNVNFSFFLSLFRCTCLDFKFIWYKFNNNNNKGKQLTFTTLVTVSNVREVASDACVTKTRTYTAAFRAIDNNTSCKKNKQYTAEL